MTTTADRLAPCPFCGEMPFLSEIPAHKHALSIGDWKMPDHPGSWVIECGCGSGKIAATVEEVTAAWNRRVVCVPSGVEKDAERYRAIRAGLVEMWHAPRDHDCFDLYVDAAIAASGAGKGK